MFASAQIDTCVYASLPVWPLTGYHWSGILHVPNFLLRHRRTTHRLPSPKLPTQDERGHRHKLYLTNLGPDCRNFMCIHTSPQPSYSLRRASRKVRCLTPSSSVNVNPLSTSPPCRSISTLPFLLCILGSILYPLDYAVSHPRITKHSYLSKQGCPTKWSASALLYKHCSSVLY
jgi:hypothetical protein